jgi:hypothetical protein
VEEVVGHVDLRHVIAPAKEIADRVKALHLEVLVLEMSVELAEVEAASHLVRVLLRHREE